jgi:myo-inositol-1-phosphate synthase
MAPHANDNFGDATGIAVEQPSSTLLFTVDSPNVHYDSDAVRAKYTYRTTDVSMSDGKFKATPKETVYDFKTQTKVGKVGVMLVGWGGVSIPVQMLECDY